MTKTKKYPFTPRLTPWKMAFSLLWGSLCVSWKIRSIRRRGRLSLFLKLPGVALRSWRLARRAGL